MPCDKENGTWYLSKMHLKLYSMHISRRAFPLFRNLGLRAAAWTGGNRRTAIPWPGYESFKETIAVSNHRETSFEGLWYSKEVKGNINVRCQIHRSICWLHPRYILVVPAGRSIAHCKALQRAKRLRGGLASRERSTDSPPCFQCIVEVEGARINQFFATKHRVRRGSGHSWELFASFVFRRCEALLKKVNHRASDGGKLFGEIGLDFIVLYKFLVTIVVLESWIKY